MSKLQLNYPASLGFYHEANGDSHGGSEENISETFANASETSAVKNSTPIVHQ